MSGRPHLSRIRGLAFDVDGVLTDGSVYVGSDGNEHKRFCVYDGIGFVWCRLMELELALVSGRESGATARRAEELRVEAVYQGVLDKRACVLDWAAARSLAPEQVLYMGDDHIDLPVFEVVGVAVAPANALPEVRAVADHVTVSSGGNGAVREAVEWLLASTGKLETAAKRYRERLNGA